MTFFRRKFCFKAMTVLAKVLAVIIVALVFTATVLSRQVSDVKENSSSDLELKLVHVVSEN